MIRALRPGVPFGVGTMAPALGQWPNWIRHRSPKPAIPGSSPGCPALTAADSFRSFWVDSAPTSSYPALAADSDCDVVVIGAGIVGVTAAHRLSSEGARVTLLEARHIGAGATGYTTGKVSSLNGLVYARLAEDFGAETARVYGEANEAGLATIADLVAQHGIDCDFRRKPNFTYTESAGGRTALEREVEVARSIDLPAGLAEAAEELPFPIAAAVRFTDQAEFHALRYLQGLAAAAVSAGCTIHEQTRVVGVGRGKPCRVATEDGSVVRAGAVIVATHLPILDRGLFFARTHAERSYALLVRLTGDVPQGMYLSDESSAHSLRAVPTKGGERLLVGGESHKAGHGDPVARYEELERWTRERFEVEAIEHRWATQDHISHDLLPFVGRLWPFGASLLTATGFRKWGLAMGTSAAETLAELALGRKHAWADAFDPARLSLRHGLGSFVKENADVGARFVGDRVIKRRRQEELAPGEGTVVGAGLGQRAVYRDDSGALHSFSARCTHLGCILNFNSAERTWDCPCHGSRFDATDGGVVEGPAVRPLAEADDPS
jgi:glycine/D-amino acid oxidase-like deaminating enzyme/nitrite reductase/ring-hydroxylating ferredoxin subunit